MPYDNQRVSPRKALQTRVVFEDEFSEGFLYFLSTDISYSGLFIESTIPLQIGTKVFLKFALYEGEKPITITAEVARIMGNNRGRGRPKKNKKIGIGLRFIGLKPSDLERIQNFINS